MLIPKYGMVLLKIALCFFLLPAFVCDTGLGTFQLISAQKVCHYLGADKGGGKSKIGIFTVTYFLNGP